MLNQVVPTGTINIEGVSSTVRRQVYLDLRDPRIRIEGPREVVATVTIARKEEEVTRKAR